MYSLDEVRNVDPEIAEAIVAEQNRQNDHIELIASENWVSKAVMAAMGSPLTNKYAEGYPGKRYYGGCECVDVVENLARERAKELLESMMRTNQYIEDHPVEQPPEGSFDFNNNPYDDYDELRKTLADFIPEFNMKLKLNSATGRYEFSADIDSVFDIAWFTLARMISEDPALENRVNNDSRPEGIMICCRNCGKFIIRKSNRQEFCDSEDCQKARNARKQKAYRERKASEKAHLAQKKRQKSKQSDARSD